MRVVTDSFIRSLQNVGLKKAVVYIESNPEENIPKLLNLLQRFDKKGHMKEQFGAFDNIVKNKSGNWYDLLVDFFSKIDPGVRKKVIENLVINASIKWKQKQLSLKEEYKCNIPWAILMDPTSACNLSCTGCWAAEYGDKLNMTLETWDSVITQGKDMGVHMFIYSGGEPLVRKKDIIAMCEKHSDCIFLSFTNGTLIDNDFADEMLRVKNFIPAISIEGYEKETDARRGKGCYKAVVKAMDILKKKKLPFGISCCYTRNNTYTVGSEEFFDDMIARGAMFAWFFTYMPVGVDATTELIANPLQRKYMYNQVRRFRKTKPIFTLDFWNDGEYVNGCIAGGRYYLHINANGDIEPCAFIHYSDSNIKDKTILEACQSPLFMEYHKNQPFNDNMLRPCPLLDNPECLKGMVERAGAKSTDLQNPEDVSSLCNKCMSVSKEWAVVSSEIRREPKVPSYN